MISVSLGLALVAGSLLASYTRLSVITFLAWSMILFATSIYLSVRAGDAEPDTFYLYVYYAFLIPSGWLLCSIFIRISASSDKPKPTDGSRSNVVPQIFSERSLQATVVLVGGVAFYHLWKVGLPLFNSNVEVQRFDFTSSGFFGIPGRLYLFGVPMMWIVTTVAAQVQSVRWRDQKSWRLATAVFFVCSLLSGFKSGLLSTLFIMTIVYVVVSGRKLTLGGTTLRFGWILIAPIAYALLTASQYRTYQASGSGVVQSLRDRLISDSSTAAQFALEKRVDFSSAYPIISDFSVTLQKYLGIGEAGSYTFERAVSAAMIGANPASDSFTVPVTIGGVAELHASFGVLITSVTLIAVGFWLRSAHRPLRGFASGTLTVFAVYGTYLWLVRGGLAYYTINLILMSVILYGIYLTVHTFVFDKSVRPEVRDSTESPKGSKVPE